MNEYFHVGEVAILQNGIRHPELDGSEVTIIRGLANRINAYTDEPLLCYLVDILLGDGILIAPQPHQLRKKFDKGSWDDCLFKPKEKENV